MRLAISAVTVVAAVFLYYVDGAGATTHPCICRSPIQAGLTGIGDARMGGSRLPLAFRGRCHSRYSCRVRTGWEMSRCWYPCDEFMRRQIRPRQPVAPDQPAQNQPYARAPEQQTTLTHKPTDEPDATESDPLSTEREVRTRATPLGFTRRMLGVHPPIGSDRPGTEYQPELDEPDATESDPLATEWEIRTRPTPYGNHGDNDIHSGKGSKHHQRGQRRGRLLNHPPRRGRPNKERSQRVNQTGDVTREVPPSSEDNRGHISLSNNISSGEESREGEYESASYNVSCVSPQGYELRKYEEAVRATAMLSASSPRSEAFHRLFLYFNGENDPNVKIPISTPVWRRMVRMRNDENSTRNTFISVSLYLPRRFWDDPPIPRDGEVFLERTSPLVFVSNFSGLADDQAMSRPYDRLHELLAQDGHRVAGEEFEVQSYNYPRHMHRHNEILIEADADFGTPTCTPQTTEEPSNDIRQCRDRECPSYSETQRINDEIVIREVGAGVYAIKQSTICNMSNAMSETYMPLRRYFQGMNVEGVSIPSTVPVLQLAVRPDMSESVCNFTYQSSFYIPEEYQTTPPIPLEESIFIYETDPVSYYVMTFHESPTPRVAFQKYNELKSLVTETEHCFLPGEFRLAFYDAPFRPLPHRYEMWIPVDEHCNDVDEGDFEEAVIPLDEEDGLILPAMNDDPNPSSGRTDRGMKRMIWAMSQQTPIFVG